MVLDFTAALVLAQQKANETGHSVSVYYGIDLKNDDPKLFVSRYAPDVRRQYPDHELVYLATAVPVYKALEA